jgi:multiple sugar transport system ATP-binding protein
VVGIRPEHLTVAEGVEASPETTLAARVELVEALGNESLVHFSTDARRVLSRGGAWTPDDATQASGDIAGASAAEGVARVDPRVPVAAGDRVALAVDVGRLHFFDNETGDAIGATGRPGVAPLPQRFPPEQERPARSEGTGIGNLRR